MHFCFSLLLLGYYRESKVRKYFLPLFCEAGGYTHPDWARCCHSDEWPGIDTVRGGSFILLMFSEALVHSQLTASLLWAWSAVETSWCWENMAEPAKLLMARTCKWNWGRGRVREKGKKAKVETSVGKVQIELCWVSTECEQPCVKYCYCYFTILK